MPKEIFKITSAGSVDDGKSTLLARLLIDTGSFHDDQLVRNYDPNNISDLLDGLESEVSQGITIDVAHRYFDSNQRRYQIADSPGHEQYTRNMATACAGSDALLLLLDVTEGLKPQSKKHIEIALRLGVMQFIIAINKLDLVNFSEKQFAKVSKSVELYFGSRVRDFPDLKYRVIPVSGLKGANVAQKSSRLRWFAGETLLASLDDLEKVRKVSEPVIINVQLIQRIFGGGRRYLATVVSGQVSENQSVFIGQNEAKIRSLHSNGKPIRRAKTGSAISFEIDRDLDISQSRILSSEPVGSSNQFEVELIWLGDEKGIKGRKLLCNSVFGESPMSITKIWSLNDAGDSKQGEKSEILANEIVRSNISFTSPVQLLPFSESFHLGRFTIVSPETGQTLAVGTVRFALRRSENVTRHRFRIGSAEHTQLSGNTPVVLWMTGLSGSGKSSLANEMSHWLYKQSRPHYVLDGDNLRFGLNRDLGFSDADRAENVRRTAEVAKLMVDAGLVVIVALISPKEADRKMAKEIIGEGVFKLVHINTPLDICETRDPKGLYKKARSGEIPNLTGVGSVYEVPESPDLVLPDLPLPIRVQLLQDLIATMDRQRRN